MKNYASLMLSLSAVLFTQLQGQYCDETVLSAGYTSYFEQKIEVNGDFLYLNPSYDHSYFVISSTNNIGGEDIFPNGTRYNNRSKFLPGFRLGAFIPCWEEQNGGFFGQFTYLNGGSSHAVSGDFLFDTSGFPGDGAQAPEDISYAGVASAHDHFLYYKVEAVIRKTLPCEGLSFGAGLQYAYVRQKSDVNSVGVFLDGSVVLPVDNHLSRRSAFWGIGPQVGAEYNYSLPYAWLPAGGDLSFIAKGQAALLCGQVDARLHYDSLRTGATGVNLRNQSLWKVVPTVDAALSLNYAFNCFCMDVDIEAGYEVIWYHDCINTITGLDAAYAGDTADMFSGFGLQGPFFSLKIDF